MATLQHPNIVRLVGAIASSDQLVQRESSGTQAAVLAPGRGHICLVTEFCSRGDLFTLLGDNSAVPNEQLGWERRLDLAIGAAAGLSWLHKRNIIHRDLKSLNLLLTADWQLKISDFGLSRFKAASASAVLTGQCGSFHWMSPEVMSGSGSYSESADVYSLGINLWELLTRCVPFDGMQPVQVVATVITRHARPPLPPSAPRAYVDLIQSCWQDDSEARPTAAAALSSLRRMRDECQVWPAPQPA